MARTSIKVRPGVDQNETSALNEAGISFSQLVRFFYDRVAGAIIQKLGGWTKYYGIAMPATVKALWAWNDQVSVSHLAAATITIPSTGVAQLSVITNNSNQVITPSTTTDNIAPVVSTTAASSTVAITDTTTTGITQYDAVYIRNHVSVGGIVLFGLYQCYNPSLSTTIYNIVAQDAIGSPLLAPTTSSSAVFVGGISGLTLTVSSVTSGTIQIGQTITGGTTSTATIITGGSGLSWTVNNSQTVTAGTTFNANPATVAAFAVTNALNTVTVTLPNHGYAVGSTYPVLTTTTVGGITLYGNYIVQTVPNSYSFTINGPQTATSTTTGYCNGGNVSFLYSFGVGANPAGSGYGINGYGRGGFGSGSNIAPSLGTAITATDWTLDNWGGGLVACAINSTNFQPIYYWDPTSGAVQATAIAQGPPISDGMFVAMPQRQIITWGSTFTGIQDPLLVRWCDVNNFNVWISQVTNQAGSYRLPKGSKIVGGMQGPQQGLLWTDVDLWSMQYISQPYVYSFNEIATGCGLIGRKAMGAINGSVYWMGTSSFFVLAGDGVRDVPCPVWDVVFQDLDTSSPQVIRTAVNSLFGEISWFFPTVESFSGQITGTNLTITAGSVTGPITIGQYLTGSGVTAGTVITGGSDLAWTVNISQTVPYGTMTVGGVNTSYVKYNVNLDVWDYGVMGRSAWIDKSVLGNPIGADTVTNYIYQHETSPDADGQPMLPSFRTGWMALSDGGSKVFIDEFWPDMKWGFWLGNQNATVNITIFAADFPNGPVTTYGPYSTSSTTTFFNPRIRARLVSFQFSSSDTGSFWRLGNPRYRGQPDGEY